MVPNRAKHYKVSINGFKSDHTLMKFEVLQDFDLESLLFLIHINDLDWYLNGIRMSVF